MTVNIGELNFNIYQGTRATGTKIYAYDEDYQADAYITFSDELEILPDEVNSLTLTLANEEAGTSSVYIRYKLEAVIKGANEDTIVPCTLNGMAGPDGSTNVVVEDSGYYYYRTAGGTNAMMGQDEDITLCTGFSIGLEQFIDDSGNFKINGSETIRLLLTVEGSFDSSF